MVSTKSFQAVLIQTPFIVLSPMPTCEPPILSDAMLWLNWFVWHMPTDSPWSCKGRENVTFLGEDAMQYIWKLVKCADPDYLICSSQIKHDSFVNMSLQYA